MGYTFNCDGCESRYDYAPPFMGEFRESFLKTQGGIFAQRYDVGETVTLCETCCKEVLL